MQLSGGQKLIGSSGSAPFTGPEHGLERRRRPTPALERHGETDTGASGDCAGMGRMWLVAVVPFVCQPGICRLTAFLRLPEPKPGSSDAGVGSSAGRSGGPAAGWIPPIGAACRS